MKNFYIEYIKEYRQQIRKSMINKPSIFAFENQDSIDFITISNLQKNLKIEFNNNFNIYHDTESIYLDNIEEYEYLYNNLADEYSKKMYVQYFTAQTLNSQHYSSPFDTQYVIEKEKELKECIDNSHKAIKVPVIGELNVFNLQSIGFNLKLFIEPIGIIIDFLLEQYRYKNILNTKQDDVVIDCGGATGDTALYFASKGASKVFVYEFIESSVDLINKQLKLNPSLEDKIKIIEKAVWERSNIELSYEDNGNSSFVGEKGKYSQKVYTQNIDDMIKEQNVSKVDLIKMDIEGAEYSALLGAKQTILKYKPNLAISIYHKKDDLYTIPKLIKEILPQYEFYFDYYTDTRYEAMLYAIHKKDKN
ncbi:MAG: FkbM family methyltransferase [Campylobacteraceae bacterium]|nr:FkbM family methyltransferase [Campylobacteraceae bacterium]